MKPKADNNNLISSIYVGIQPGNGSTGLAYNSNDGKINVTNLNAKLQTRECCSFCNRI
jgi:hypothetical protein